MCYCFLLDVSVFFDFSCSSHESFSSFLVFLSRAGGFGPSISAWRLALPPWEGVGNFRSGGCPFLFQFWVGPSCRVGSPFPGLALRVGVGQAPSWKASLKGEKGKARGPAKRKGRGGARPDPEGEGQA